MEHAAILRGRGGRLVVYPPPPFLFFEAGFEFALFALLWWLLTRTNRLRGRLLALYLLIYPVGRFFLEFLRGDDYRGFLFGLSTSQIISILVFAGSAVFFIVKWTNRNRMP